MVESVVRDKLFISYSHRDKDWFERFERMLKPVANAENLCVVWSDKEIKPGEPWDDKITRALESSKIALLLVSSSFLASDYVNKSELPAIIGAHAEKGLGIFWVLLEQALFDFGPLKNIQAASSVDISLAEITDDGVRMAAIAKICRQIGNELGQYSSMEQSSRYDLKREVQKVLPDSITLEDEAGAGAFTIVYFATSIKDGDRLVVKAAAPSPLDDWDIKSIKEHLTKARTLSHASFIRIRHEATGQATDHDHGED